MKSFQKNLAYRAANVAGIATNLFFGAVYVLVYRALFTGQVEVGGFTVTDTVTYAVVAQSLLMVMSAFGNRELSEAIVKGTIAVDLARPHRLLPLLGRGRSRPGRLLSSSFAPFRRSFWAPCCSASQWPAGPSVWLLFLATIVLGMLVSFAFRFITNSLAFWTSDARGVST